MKLKAAAQSVLLLVTAVSFIEVESARAVPAFARREGAQCQMCHFRLPELNEDGHSYIRRGLREEQGGMASAHGAMAPQQGYGDGNKGCGEGASCCDGAAAG